MKSNPLISIVIPVYNGEDTILRSVNSALNQTYRNIEVIVVDDKSTDNTLKVLDTIKDTRLKVIKQKKNYQIGSIARNAGMRASQGEYIAFLDDDDEFHTNKIDKLYRKISIMGEKYRVVSSDYKVLERNRWRYVKKVEEEQTVQNLLLMKVSVGGCSIMIHRSLLDDVGYFDETFRRHQDLEYTIRILRETKMAVVNEPLHKVYGHPGTPNANKFLEVKKHFLDSFRRDIQSLNKTIQKEVYARHWLQVARFFALDGDVINTFIYFFKSISYKLLHSNKVRFMPRETYFLIPFYLLKGIIFGKRKWQQ